MVTSASMVPASVAVTSILPPTSSVTLPAAPSMAACVGVSGPTQAWLVVLILLLASTKLAEALPPPALTSLLMVAVMVAPTGASSSSSSPPACTATSPPTVKVVFSTRALTRAGCS